MSAETLLFAPSLPEAFNLAGMAYPGTVDAGKFIRFSTNERDRTDRAGWLNVFQDGAGAAFGDWRSGASYCWQQRDTDAPQPSRQEREEARKRHEEARKQAETERTEAYARAASECTALWGILKPATASHNYVQHKEIGPHLARIDHEGRLVLPVFDARGELQSLQFIAPDGSKRFYPGGKMKEGRLYLGKPTDGKPLVLVEGFATGASIHEAAGVAVCCGFSGGNLRPVAESLRKLFPNSPLIVAGDLDAHGAGKRYAEAAAEAGAPARVVLPTFRDGRQSGDFNDLSAAEGRDEARRQLLFDGLNVPGRFKLLTAADLAGLPPMRELVRGVLPATGLGAMFGPSGSGKSFLNLDLLGAVTTGRDWFDHAIPNPCKAVYVALEGEAGVSKRVAAFMAKNGRLDGLRVILSPLDVRLANDRAALVQSIKAEGFSDGVLVLDTLNRAAVGMDENSSVDMGEVIAGMKALQAELGGLVLAVHHSGKDVLRGMRGHSSLLAALDVVIEVTRQEDRREWKLSKSKDGEDGKAHPFRLDVVELGLDEDGWPITSCTIEPEEQAAEGIQKSRIPGGGNMRIAWDRLGELLRQSQHFGKASAPLSRPCIELEAATADIAGRLTCEQKRRRERSQTAITGLVARGLMVHEGGWLWCK